MYIYQHINLPSSIIEQSLMNTYYVSDIVIVSNLIWHHLSKNTGVGCHFFLQGIFLTQGSNLHVLRLLCWQMDSLPLSHLGRQHRAEVCAYRLLRGSQVSELPEGVRSVWGPEALSSAA